MADLVIGGKAVALGSRETVDLPMAKLYTDVDINIPVHVIRSKNKGPIVFVSAAVHGDELNGIEIIRRMISSKTVKLISGSLILVPMVNVYGVLNQSRYMPDRRDLNRSFPGSPRGSLAGRVANTFLTQVVSQCDYGIDLHTGALHRSNLPQIRADLTNPETQLLAEAFGVPVLINANLRDGSLREAAAAIGVTTLLYEAGEALRFDELSVRAGVRGIINVLRHLGMVKKRVASSAARVPLQPFIANNSSWVRADSSGIVHNLKNLGDQVEQNEVLALIGDPLGQLLSKVVAGRSGIIIGKQNIPLVQEGDAMFHIAYFSGDDEKIAENIGMLQDTLLTDEVGILDM